MKWQELRGEWDADCEHAEAMRREFPYREVADAITGLRARFRLTQTQLAERVGTQQSVIARLESGKHPVEVKMLYRIADALGVSWHPTFVFPDVVTDAASEEEATTEAPAVPVAAGLTEDRSPHP